jgi:hypothetical protein
MALHWRDPFNEIATTTGRSEERGRILITESLKARRSKIFLSATWRHAGPQTPPACLCSGAIRRKRSCCLPAALNMSGRQTKTESEFDTTFKFSTLGPACRKAWWQIAACQLTIY